MAGAKTRFGFVGNGSEPPDSDEARAARTVIGREVHLPKPPDPRPAGWPAPPEASSATRAVATAIPRAPTAGRGAAVPVSRPEEDTEELPSRRPSRPGGSRLARFLGRWTESGRFVSKNHGPEDDVEIPRNSLGRNVLLVLAAAVLAFSLTFLLVKLQRHFSRASTPTAAPAQAPAPLTPAPSPPPR